MECLTALAADSVVDAIIGVIDAETGSPTIKVYDSSDVLCFVATLNATASFTPSGDARDESTGAATDGKAWAAAPVDGGGHWDTFSKLPESGSQGLVGSYAVICDAAGVAQYRPSLGTVAGGTAEVRLTTLTFDEAVAVTMTTCPYIQIAIASL